MEASDRFRSSCRDCDNTRHRKQRKNPEYHTWENKRTAARNIKKYQSDPVYRKRVLAARRKQYHNDPIYRNKILSACKLRRENSHGLSKNKKKELFLKQNKKCKICFAKIFLGTNKKRATAHLDHDHHHCKGIFGCPKCFRGFLCGNCNRMIGLAKERIKTLQAAISYLGKTAWAEAK